MPPGAQPGAFSGPPIPGGPQPGTFGGQPGSFGGGQPFPPQAPVPSAPVPTAYYPQALPSRGQPPMPPPSAPLPTSATLPSATQLPARQPAAQPAPASQQAPSAQPAAPPLPSRRPGRLQADGPGQPGTGSHRQGGHSRGFEPEWPGPQESGSWFTSTRTTATTGPADATLPSAPASPGPVTATGSPRPELSQRAGRHAEDLRGQPEPTTRTSQGFQPSWQDEAELRPPRFEPQDRRDDQDLADPDFETQGYQAQGYQAEGYPTQGYQAQGYQAEGYPQAPDFDERRRFDETRFDGTRLDGGQLDSTRFDQVGVAEPKRRSGRKKNPAAKGGPINSAPTLVDQPRLQETPVYQTGMQLVVPAGEEWTFRDPGTGAFPGVRPDRFGDQDQQDPNGPGGWGGPSGRGGPAAFPPPVPRGPRAAGQPAPQPDAGPYTVQAAPAGRRGGRKAPLFIGVGAAVVVLGIGAAVAAPRLLQHPDPGCTAYRTSALPAYNQTITDLNAQASQATLNSDLTTAVAQLSAAASQAQGAPVKSALQGLLTRLTQVQADTQKGSVPAATVTQLNTAAVATDNTCGSS
jgi:hypothetical protein